MTNEEAFARWKAAAGSWAAWIKPSLFAQGWAASLPGPTQRDLKWLPSTPDTALVLDLPGPESIEVGLALIGRGYCPVPLFNTTPGDLEAIDTSRLVALLWAAAETLQPRTSGPPVFLLDADRQSPAHAVGIGDLDNRWFVFASDLPTPRAFQERGIAHLTVVYEKSLARDLHDALAGHRELGPTTLDRHTKVSAPLPPTRPALMRGLSSLGRVLHRNADGSFGHRLSQG